MTLGGLAYTDEIFNVSIWFGNGQTRRLGWFPYSLYLDSCDLKIGVHTSSREYLPGTSCS